MSSPVSFLKMFIASSLEMNTTFSIPSRSEIRDWSPVTSSSVTGSVRNASMSRRLRSVSMSLDALIVTAANRPTRMREMLMVATERRLENIALRNPETLSRSVYAKLMAKCSEVRFVAPADDSPRGAGAGALERQVRIAGDLLDVACVEDDGQVEAADDIDGCRFG